MANTVRPFILPALGAGLLLWPLVSFAAGPQHLEKHFQVKGRPVVVMQNVANGRIEVKSSKNPEVLVAWTQGSDKINVEPEQVDNRVDVTASILDLTAQPQELEANFQLTVPEET
jgi:hypothetical protein